MLQRRISMLTTPQSDQRRLCNLLQSADLSLANLEVCLSDRGEPRDKFFTLRASPTVAHDIKSLGFGVVGVANNHAWDYGPEAFADTLSICREVGLETAGGGRNLDEACSPVTITESDQRIVIFAFSATLPPDSAAGASKAGIAPVRVTTSYEIDPIFSQEQPGTAPYVRTHVQPVDARHLLDAVSHARASNTLVVVLLHWGVPPYWHAPFEGDLAEYQRPFAREVADAGAGLILGSHPHIVQGVEVIGSCIVFYSLGNFIFHTRDRQGAALATTPGYKLRWKRAFEESAENKRKRESILVLAEVEESKLSDVRIVPIVLSDMGEPSIAHGSSSADILHDVQELSRRLKTTVDIMGESAMIPHK
jgi:poly-gamma-glutamate synthesis protein (capsule biosynthesis protein)